MIKGFELPDGLAEKLAEGDERCKYAIGSKVVKATYEPGDHHQIGSKGIVVGSIQIPTPPMSGIGNTTDAYLIQFDSDLEGVVAFTIQDKLLSEDEFQNPS